MKKHELEALCQMIGLATGTISEMEASLVKWSTSPPVTDTPVPHLIITERIGEEMHWWDGEPIPSWDDKIKVIKVLRTINSRLWLREAKKLSEQELPIVVKIPYDVSMNELRSQLNHCNHTKWEIKTL